MSLRRIGKFKIPMHVLQDADTAAILGKLEFVPMHADMNSCEGEALYTGLSPMFDEVGIGNKIPDYIIICHKDGDGNVDKVEAVKEGG